MTPASHIHFKGLVTFIALLSSGAISCTDVDSEEWDGRDGEPKVEVGTGAFEFEPLGDELDLIQGLQGGFHFNLDARILNLRPGEPDDPGSSDNPSTLFSCQLEDGTRIDASESPRTIGYEATDSPWYEVPGYVRLVLDSRVAADLDGTTVGISVQVTDADGFQATDEHWGIVRLVCDHRLCN